MEQRSIAFVSVGLGGFRETWDNHIVVRISTRLFRHAPRVPFSLSSAYNWIYQVKVEIDGSHAFLLQTTTTRTIGTSTDARETCMSNIGRIG